MWPRWAILWQSPERDAQKSLWLMEGIKHSINDQSEYLDRKWSLWHNGKLRISHCKTVKTVSSGPRQPADLQNGLFFLLADVDEAQFRLRQARRQRKEIVLCGASSA